MGSLSPQELPGLLILSPLWVHEVNLNIHLNFYSFKRQEMPAK